MSTADRLTALRSTIDQQGIIDPNRETRIAREMTECLQDLNSRVAELERFVISRLPTSDQPEPGEVVRKVPKASDSLSESAISRAYKSPKSQRTE